MIRQIGNMKVFVGIISHLRSENVPKMHNIVGENVTWVVGDNEKEILEKIKENEKLGNYIKGKLIKKTIFISNKLINIII